MCNDQISQSLMRYRFCTKLGRHPFHTESPQFTVTGQYMGYRCYSKEILSSNYPLLMYTPWSLGPSANINSPAIGAWLCSASSSGNLSTYNSLCQKTARQMRFNQHKLCTSIIVFPRPSLAIWSEQSQNAECPRQRPTKEYHTEAAISLH